MFSCEYCEAFKNIYFEEHLGTVASETTGLLSGWTSLLLNSILEHRKCCSFSELPKASSLYRGKCDDILTKATKSMIYIGNLITFTVSNYYWLNSLRDTRLKQKIKKQCDNFHSSGIRLGFITILNHIVRMPFSVIRCYLKCLSLYQSKIKIL